MQRNRTRLVLSLDLCLEMARGSRSVTSSSKWRYCNPSYYLKRPKRLALLFIVFVGVSFIVWDRQTLVREHQVYLTYPSALPTSRFRSVILLFFSLQWCGDHFATTCTEILCCCVLRSIEIVVVVDYLWWPSSICI